MVDILRNPNDPLHKITSPQGKELFRKFGEVANGFSNDAVIDAAMNLLINVVRQAASTRDSAEKIIDLLNYQVKVNLLEHHYDNTGKRRNVFPFQQGIKFEQ